MIHLDYIELTLQYFPKWQLSYNHHRLKDKDKAASWTKGGRVCVTQVLFPVVVRKLLTNSVQTWPRASPRRDAAGGDVRWWCVLVFASVPSILALTHPLSFPLHTHLSQSPIHSLTVTHARLLSTVCRWKSRCDQRDDALSTWTDKKVNE